MINERINSVLTCVIYNYHVWSAGSSFNWGREWGGPAVPVHFPADRGGREYWGATERWGECEYGGGVGLVIGHASGNNGNCNIITVLLCRNKHHTWLSVYSLISCSKWRSQPMNSKMSWTRWCLNVRIFEWLFLGYGFSVYCLQETICYLQTKTYTLRASVERTVEAWSPSWMYPLYQDCMSVLKVLSSTLD